MNNRYYSLDVFRGLTVALMILVNNPGSWSYIYAPLEHAKWHGCTPTDLVFPFFLFAVGNAMAFVMPRFLEKGTPFFLKKVLKRTLIIFTIGLLLNWSPFVKWDNNVLIFKKWEDLRIMGVLQRIALCYCFASLIAYFTKPRVSILIGAALLLIYWALCLMPGSSSNPYSLSGFFGTQIDISILKTGHMYKGEGTPFDPEGLVSTLPAIVQVLLGYLIGCHIRQKNKDHRLLLSLFTIATVLIIAGLLWSPLFPLNKKIWSSSFVLYTTGLATLTIAALIFIIEFKNYKGEITRFFDVFGKNPLFIFVLSGFLPRLLSLVRIADHRNGDNQIIYLSPLGWLYEHICKPVSENLKNGSLLYALIMLLFYWSIVYVLDKKRIYIKV